MASKFVQGKEGQVLTYPKTLVQAVFKSENGESIEEDIKDLQQNGETTAAALCVLQSEVDSLQKGNVDYGKVLTVPELALTDAEIQAESKKVTSAKYGKFLKDESDKNEEIIAAAFNALNTINVLSSSIAPKFSSSTSYEVGDCCTYNSGFFECINPGSGLFSEDNWKRTSLIEYIKKHFVQ